MKRTVCMLLALCLMAGCGLVGAESGAPEEKPWINSSVLDYLPAERPEPEDGFDMYVNYDTYMEAKEKGTDITLSLFEETELIARGQILDLCRGTESEFAEDEILRILYGLVTDTEKRNADGIAPLMAKVDRVKAVETTDGLLALLQEEGFLPCDPFYEISVQQSNDGSGQVVIMCSKAALLDIKPPAVSDINGYYEPEKDTETPKAMLMRMRYSEEEAAALAERMKEYDDYADYESVEWYEGKRLTIEQLKENSPLLYA